MADKKPRLGNWKDWFTPHILDRGYQYYGEGRISKIHEEEERITAVVLGTQPYHVSIVLDDSGVTDVDCDCPYADDDSHCKHEAAVLYYLNEQYPNDGNEEIQEDLWDLKLREDEELLSVIERIPEQELRHFLYQLAKNDQVLKSQIIAKYSESVGSEQLRSFRNVILEIQRNYSDRYGFVDWRNASNYIQALVSFLYDNAEPLIERGKLELAFELICEVFITIGSTDIDDDGDVAYGADSCYSLWKQIVQRASDEQQRKMYQWFEEYSSNGKIIDYMEDYLNSFQWNEFHAREFLLKKLEKLHSEIQEQEKIRQQDPKGPMRSFWMAEKVLNYIHTMEELEYPQEQIQETYQKYWYLSEVLVAYAEALLEKKEYGKAVQLLENAKKTEENDNVISGYSKLLIRTFQEMDERERLQQELEFQITTCIQGDQQFIQELKRLLPENEWNDWKTRIPQLKSCGRIRMEFLREEKMYQEMMKEIRQSSMKIYLLDLYEKDLREKYSDEIRDLYAQCVVEAASKTTNRKEYRRLMRDLKKMLRYSGGPELAGNIAKKWKSEFSRRPAFLDELGKAGF